MTRPWMRPRMLPFAVAAAACAAAFVPARSAHGGLIETAALTAQSARLAGQAGVTGPAWSPAQTGALRPSGAAPTPPVTRLRDRRAAAAAPPPRVPRPASGAPGAVAGLVYERGTQVPIPYVNVSLVSTEAQYVETMLTARTDSAGYYEFAAVEPGLWRLSIHRDGLAITWAVPRVAHALSVAKREKVAIPPFAVGRQACVEGKAVWSDGYTLFDAPVTVVPASPDLGAAGGMLNGIGEYVVCEASEDSAMVWMHLRDGRSLGRSTRLVAGTKPRVDFTPDPLEKMEGSPLRVFPVLSDGTPVPRAQILVVGRRFEQGPRPALVFVREDASDADGVAEFKVPFGNYEVLVMNPREGQTGTQRMIVDLDQTGNLQPLRVELTGAKSAEERDALKRSMLERAERSLAVWTQ